MKKFAAIFLSALMMLSLLVACTDSGSSSASSSTAPAGSSSAVASQSTEPGGLRDDGLPAYTGEATELRFTWWGGDVRAERTNQVIELFMEAYPEITIVAEPKPSDSYWDSLNTQLAGGNAPDLMQFGGNYPDFTNYLLPLQDYVGNQLQVGTAAEFDQQPLEVGTTDGNLYGICLGTNALMLVYNKTMLEDAGAALPPETWTWDEMIAYAEEIKDLLPDGVYPFVDNSVNQANYLSYYYQQNGEPLWTYEGESFATEATSTAWFAMWEDMRDKGLIPDIETTAGYAETSVDTSILVPGKAAIGLLWSNQLGTYQESMTDTLGVATLPTGNEDALTIQVSQYLAVNNTCANPEAAALFINFFVRSPEAGAILGTDRGIPSSPEVRSQAEASANDIDKLLFAYLNQVAPTAISQGPNLPNDQEFIDNLKQIGQNIAFGNQTVEQGGADLYELIQRLMVK